MAPDLCYIWNQQCRRVDFVRLFNTTPAGAGRPTVENAAERIAQGAGVPVCVFFRIFHHAGTFRSVCFPGILCQGPWYRGGRGSLPCRNYRRCQHRRSAWIWRFRRHAQPDAPFSIDISDQLSP